MSAVQPAPSAPPRRATRATQAIKSLPTPTNKVNAAGIGGAIATLFWVIACSTFWKGTFDDTALSALTTASTTILAFGLGYVVKETSTAA